MLYSFCVNRTRAIVLCFFSSLLQDRHTFEKVGKSTEVGLKVLVEKLNLSGINCSVLNPQENATASLRSTLEQYKKVN